MATIAERVAAGAAFLDGRHPRWWRVIDLEHLDLGDGCRCILGQLLDDYISVEYVHFRHARHAYGLGYPETTDLGFDADPDGPDDEFEQLTTEWAALIAARLGNGKTPVGGPRMRTFLTICAYAAVVAAWTAVALFMGRQGYAALGGTP